MDENLKKLMREAMRPAGVMPTPEQRRAWAKVPTVPPRMSDPIVIPDEAEEPETEIE